MMARSLEPAKSFEKILVRGVNWLGDAVMTTPALLRLREARPDAKIVLLTPAKLSELWRHHPAIDSVISFESEGGLWSVANRLRNEHFQVGLILPNSPRSALEIWLARIPQRIGYAARWRRWLLTTSVAARRDAVPMRKKSIAEIRQRIQSPASSPSENFAPAAHHVFHYLHLTEALGASPEPMAPQLFVTESEVEILLNRWPALAASDRPLFGLNPGAEYGPAKRWPVASFLAAAIEIRRQTNCRWVIFGGKSDAPLATEIAAGLEVSSSEIKTAGPSVINLAGATTLRELCVALKQLRVLLTNDTGPMHVAAALGTPVVVPFGSTSPELTGPGLPHCGPHALLKASVPCSPCFLRECPIDFRCMQSISVDAVVRAVVAAHRAR